jgi:uracil phosphoribosyltransferase
VVQQTITTPLNTTYQGVKFAGNICGVSIMRAGEAMEQGLRDCCRSVRIGKILIQRDEETSQPKLFYDKLPEDIAQRWVLLLDPMLATGGSALMAVDVLKGKGVPEEHIMFLNLIARPEGARRIAEKAPKVRVVTAFVDQGLNEKKYVLLIPPSSHTVLETNSSMQLYCARSRRLWRPILHHVSDLHSRRSLSVDNTIRS